MMPSHVQPEEGTSFHLVQVKGAWSRQEEPSQHGHAGGRVSDATIHQRKCEHGVVWTVSSPVVFTYRIVQCDGLLDPANDTLLWGHLGGAELRAAAAAAASDSRPVRRFVVIDENVNGLFGAELVRYLETRRVVHRILALPTTEENKNLSLVGRILEEAHRFGLDRRAEPIIAVGGGVCLDAVGLAASLYRRRTPYVRVPTTLLAYVDASVGAKNGVNFAGGKNKVGSYVPPVAAFLDRRFLRTLPPRHLSNGMAEMLKMALMKHRGLFELLEAEGRTLLDTKLQSYEGEDGAAAAASSTRIAIETMLEELAPNLWEDDLDRLVDFGHLVSPELEMRVLPALLHGEAVNIDMSFMVYVAHQRALLSAQEKERVVRCMLGLALPVWHRDCSLDLIQAALRERLRHSGGSLRMPLPTGLGRAEIFHDMIEEDILRQAHRKWTEELSSYGNK